MTVKKYLVNRIMELEENLKQVRNEYARAIANAQMLKEDIKDLNEMLDRYEMEKDHIKQIITCNIGRNVYNHLSINIDIGTNDFKTLLAILDIGPEDYEMDDHVKEDNNAETKD